MKICDFSLTAGHNNCPIILVNIKPGALLS